MYPQYNNMIIIKKKVLSIHTSPALNLPGSGGDWHSLRSLTSLISNETEDIYQPRFLLCEALSPVLSSFFHWILGAFVIDSCVFFVYS
jgi:hypothetical protein